MQITHSSMLDFSSKGLLIAAGSTFEGVSADRGGGEEVAVEEEDDDSFEATRDGFCGKRGKENMVTYMFIYIKGSPSENDANKCQPHIMLKLSRTLAGIC